MAAPKYPAEDLDLYIDDMMSCFEPLADAYIAFEDEDAVAERVRELNTRDPENSAERCLWEDVEKYLAVVKADREEG